METESRTFKVIARIRSDFPTKFGIPRQSGLVKSLTAQIIFEPPFRNPDAVRGLEQFSHIWLMWEFSQAVREEWSPTVRPPRLGGNKRMGVFATRSPFRPNAIGLSAVKLEGIHMDASLGPVLEVTGADLMDHTPIFDIKPYLPFADSYPEALGGFAEPLRSYRLEVEFPEPWRSMVPPDRLEGLTEVLAQDPRPSYHHDPERQYGFSFCGMEVHFTVEENRLTVREIIPG